VRNTAFVITLLGSTLFAYHFQHFLNDPGQDATEPTDCHSMRSSSSDFHTEAREWRAARGARRCRCEHGVRHSTCAKHRQSVADRRAAETRCFPLLQSHLVRLCYEKRARTNQYVSKYT